MFDGVFGLRWRPTWRVRHDRGQSQLISIETQSAVPEINSSVNVSFHTSQDPLEIRTTVAHAVRFSYAVS